MRQVRIGAALLVFVVVVIAVLTIRGDRTRTVVCDGYNVWSLGDSMHRPVFISPPPGWREVGPGCWGEP